MVFIDGSNFYRCLKSHFGTASVDFLHLHRPLSPPAPDLRPLYLAGQGDDGAVIFDLHLPPLEKGITFTRKHLYDERRDRFCSLQELCPHIKQRTGVLDPGGVFTDDGGVLLDQLYRDRMNSLQAYWPYEIVEKAADKMREALEDEGKEPSRVRRPELRKRVRELLAGGAEAVLRGLLDVIHLEDNAKRRAAHAKLEEGLRFAAETIAAGMQRRFKGESSRA